MNEEEQNARIAHQRGGLAKQVMDNPIYQEALIVIKADLMRRFEGTKFKDSGERDEIWRTMNNLNKLCETIEDVMITGEMAEETLSFYQKLTKR